MAKKKYTFGLFIDWIDYQYDSTLFKGVNDAALKNNCNLICFQGGNIHDTNSFRNSVYYKAVNSNIDGLIISSASLSSFITKNQLINFFKKFHPLPIVSIGVDLENYPSVIVDNKIGMKELVNHLITEHNFKKFAFIKGPDLNKESIMRFEAFKETLNENKIKLDNDLVIQGDFIYHSGVQAARTLLDERKKDFDVIVSSNDEMALGAIEELRKRGVQIPWDLAVTGFDNLDFSKTSLIPITTVYQPIYEQGKEAANILLNQLKGIKKETKIVFNTKLIIRESCSCLSKGIRLASTGLKLSKNKQNNIIEKINIKKIIRNISSKIKSYETEHKIQKYLTSIIISFFDYITKKNKIYFLSTLDKTLSELIYKENDIIEWQNIISELRSELSSYVNDKDLNQDIENIWHQCRVMICEKILLSEKNREQIKKQKNENLNFLNDDFLLALSVDQQIKSLSDKLPKIGIKNCYLSLVKDKSRKKQQELIFSFKNNKSIKIKKKTAFFSYDLLLPSKQLSKKERFTLVYIALISSNKLIGYILFEIGPDEVKYVRNLCRIISNSLHKGLLFNKVQEQTESLQFQKKQLKKSLKKLEKAMNGFIYAMSFTIESRDPYTAGHQKRVSNLAYAIAVEMKLDQEIIESVQIAGIIHDLGKIYVPAEILNKPGKLKDVEFSLIKNHPQISYEILKNIDFPWPIANIVLQHHERLNGSGYPNGLKGDEIMLEAKIICVADVVEAMASYRPYRPAMGIKLALNEISKYRGIYYDVNVVDACIKIFQKGFKFK